jgi:ferrous iron transport protein B
MTLLDLRPGQSGKIIEVGGEMRLRIRLVGLGLAKGKIITLIKNAPLHDPLEFALVNWHILLRRQEARLIQIEPWDKP